MSISHDAVCAFLYREARLLDDRDWDAWLECYAPDATFWMPAWDDDGKLTEDPQSEISLIYYSRRAGLEDRVFRIRTERSSATIPDTRTSHNITNVEIVEQSGDQVKVRFNWVTFSVRYNHTDIFAGTSFYTLDVSGPSPIIKEKKIVLKTDYVRHVIDVYHV
ncbi:benzoate 1,2-dioxygenase small subunit [Rhodocyclus purpureus]|uniref:benzoate 1,2-dioxygenase small subunit n=1 Tax=Rhodocyclus purpureus TaxID=1067 RepID=UPI001911AE76|nr:benzoate 1,2-dioxygenase small subunit [Rhodocyclus purpureus]MBK5913989.1 benzoate 1,2-dioxygenase small subunit [Rhodocyclus purpureus]